MASSSELPKTIGRILLTVEGIRLTFTLQSEDGSGPLEIQTLDPPYLVPTLPFRVSECSGLKLSTVTEGPNAWNDLAEAIGLKGFAGATALVVGCAGISALYSRTGSAALPVIRRLTEDMRESIRALELRTDLLPLLRYLSVPQPVTGAESAKYWPCPKLRHVLVHAESCWLEADRDELLQQCIKVLRRSSVRVDSLVLPRQLEELSSNSSSGLQETLSRMDEFRNVKFSKRGSLFSWQSQICGHHIF